MISPALKEYHRTHNIPNLRNQTAEQLEQLAGEIRSGALDLDKLENVLLDLCGMPDSFGRRFSRLWQRLRSLKVALRD